MNSPTWTFYDSAGKIMEIASEDKFDNWKWKINKADCPSILLNPTRLSKINIRLLTCNNLFITLNNINVFQCLR
jgi:hypothetical protein